VLLGLRRYRVDDRQDADGTEKHCGRCADSNSKHDLKTPTSPNVFNAEIVVLFRLLKCARDAT
jgi:hypothetical protein